MPLIRGHSPTITPLRRSDPIAKQRPSLPPLNDRAAIEVLLANVRRTHEATQKAWCAVEIARLQRELADLDLIYPVRKQQKKPN
jgi:hypothetical protein